MGSHLIPARTLEPAVQPLLQAPVGRHPLSLGVEPTACRPYSYKRKQARSCAQAWLPENLRRVPPVGLKSSRANDRSRVLPGPRLRRRVIMAEEGEVAVTLSNE